MTGHGTAVGHYAGMVISYATRCKDCRLCKMGHPASTTIADAIMKIQPNRWRHTWL